MWKRTSSAEISRKLTLVFPRGVSEKTTYRHVMFQRLVHQLRTRGEGKASPRRKHASPWKRLITSFALVPVRAHDFVMTKNQKTGYNQGFSVKHRSPRNPMKRITAPHNSRDYAHPLSLFVITKYGHVV